MSQLLGLGGQFWSLLQFVQLILHLLLLGLLLLMLVGLQVLHLIIAKLFDRANFLLGTLEHHVPRVIIDLGLEGALGHLLLHEPLLQSLLLGVEYILEILETVGDVVHWSALGRRHRPKPFGREKQVLILPEESTGALHGLDVRRHVMEQLLGQDR
jgi:hypothetical protein